MKRFLIALIICCLVNINLFAVNKCYITVNLQECINCFQSIRFVNKIDSGLETNLVFKTKDSKQVKPFLKEVVNLEWEEKKTIISDSIYDALNKENSISLVHVLNQNNVVVFTCKLKDLSSQIENLNKFGSLTLKESVESILPDSVVLSQRTIIKESNSDYFLYDYLYNKFYRVPKSKPSNFKIISSQSFDKKKIHKICFDANFPYEKALLNTAALNSVGKNKIEILNFVLDKQTLNLILGYNYVVDSLVNNDTVSFIKQKQLLANFSPNKPVKYYVIPSLPDKTYSLNLGTEFFLNNGNFLFQIRKSKTNNDNKLLALFKFNGDKLEFGKMLDVELPEFFVENQLNYNFASGFISPPYITFSVCNKVVNYETGATNRLPFKDKNSFNNIFKPSLNYVVLDFKKYNEAFKILLKYNNEYYLVYLDEKMNLIEKRKLNDGLNSIVSNFVFSDKNSIIGLDSNGKLIKEYY